MATTTNTRLIGAGLLAIVLAATSPARAADSDRLDLPITSKILKKRLEAAGPEALPAYTASTLARDYRIDADAADRRYKGRWFVVGGRLAEIAEDDPELISLWIAGEDETRDMLRADLFADQICAISRKEGIRSCAVKAKVASLRPGDPIRLECRGAGAPAKTPVLGDCLVYGGP